MFLDSLDKAYDAIELQDRSENLDFESQLLFFIMRSAASSLTEVGEVRTFDQFKRSYEKELKATGRVLEWLGLAKCDKEAPLGWRSTIRLQYALVQRGYIPREVRRASTRKEEELFEAIYQEALGKRVTDETHQFVTIQLVEFGLARTYADEYYIPDLSLKNLFKEAKAPHSGPVAGARS